MKFLAAFASTLLIVLISQQSTRAFPIDDFTTPSISGDELTTVSIEGRSVEVDATTVAGVQERALEDELITPAGMQEPTVEDPTTPASDIEERAVEDELTTPAGEQDPTTPAPEVEERALEDELSTPAGGEEPTVEDPTTPASDVEERAEEDELTTVSTEEEPVKETESSTQRNGPCPTGYVKYEDGCLKVTKNKDIVSPLRLKARSDLKEGTAVQSYPENADGSCPVGTDHGERGVCEKIVSDSDLKNKHSVCPENGRFIEGRCIFGAVEPKNTVATPVKSSEHADETSEDPTTVQPVEEH